MGNTESLKEQFEGVQAEESKDSSVAFTSSTVKDEAGVRPPAPLRFEDEKGKGAKTDEHTPVKSQDSSSSGGLAGEGRRTVEEQLLEEIAGGLESLTDNELAIWVCKANSVLGGPVVQRARRVFGKRLALQPQSSYHSAVTPTWCPPASEVDPAAAFEWFFKPAELRKPPRVNVEFWESSPSSPWRDAVTKKPVTKKITVRKETEQKQKIQDRDAPTARRRAHAAKLHQLGVSVSWLLSLTFALDLWEWPTFEVALFLVKNATEFRGRCRFAELPEVKPHTGPAGVYVCHCWGGKWGDLVSACCTGSSLDRFVYVDLFAVRQWPGNDADMDFRGVIALCESVLVVAAPLDSPSSSPSSLSPQPQSVGFDSVLPVLCPKGHATREPLPSSTLGKKKKVKTKAVKATNTAAAGSASSSSPGGGGGGMAEKLRHSFDFFSGKLGKEGEIDLNLGGGSVGVLPSDLGRCSGCRKPFPDPWAATAREASAAATAAATKAAEGAAASSSSSSASSLLPPLAVLEALAAEQEEKRKRHASECACECAVCQDFKLCRGCTRAHRVRTTSSTSSGGAAAAAAAAAAVGGGGGGGGGDESAYFRSGGPGSGSAGSGSGSGGVNSVQKLPMWFGNNVLAKTAFQRSAAHHTHALGTVPFCRLWCLVEMHAALELGKPLVFKVGNHSVHKPEEDVGKTPVVLKVRAARSAAAASPSPSPSSSSSSSSLKKRAGKGQEEEKAGGGGSGGRKEKNTKERKGDKIRSKTEGSDVGGKKSGNIDETGKPKKKKKRAARAAVAEVRDMSRWGVTFDEPLGPDERALFLLNYSSLLDLNEAAYSSPDDLERELMWLEGGLSGGMAEVNADLATALYTAAFETTNACPEVECFLHGEKGALRQLEPERVYTAFECASSGGRLEVMCELLCSRPDEVGDVVFHLCRAASKGHLQAIVLLLAYGQEKTASSSSNGKGNADAGAGGGKTSSSTGSSAGTGPKNAQNTRGQGLVNCASYGRSPLACAAEHGQVDASALLLAKGAAVNLDAGGRGTALYWAVVKGEVDVAQLLLSAGADPDLASLGLTPFKVAQNMVMAGVNAIKHGKEEASKEGLVGVAKEEKRAGGAVAEAAAALSAEEAGKEAHEVARLAACAEKIIKILRAHKEDNGE